MNKNSYNNINLIYIIMYSKMQIILKIYNKIKIQNNIALQIKKIYNNIKIKKHIKLQIIENIHKVYNNNKIKN